LPNVVEFELEERLSWDELDPAPTVPLEGLVSMQLDHLRSLKLRAQNTRLWDILVLPTLEEVDTMAEPGSISALTSVTRRSSCCLTSLRLLRTEKDSRYLTSFLYTVPTVTDLSIISPHDFPECLSLMLLRDDNPSRVLLPNLTSLSVYANEGHWNINWMVEIIRSRWSLSDTYKGSVARLTTCSLSFDVSNMFGADISIVGLLDALGVFAEEGMDMTTREDDYRKYTKKPNGIAQYLPANSLTSCVIS